MNFKHLAIGALSAVFATSLGANYEFYRQVTASAEDSSSYMTEQTKRKMLAVEAHRQFVQHCYSGQEPAQGYAKTDLSNYLASVFQPVRNLSVNIKERSREEVIKTIRDFPREEHIHVVFDYYEEAFARMIGAQGSEIYELAELANLSGEDFEAFLSAVQKNEVFQCFQRREIEGDVGRYEKQFPDMSSETRTILGKVKEDLPQTIFLKYAAQLAQVLASSEKAKEYMEKHRIADNQLKADIGFPVSSLQHCQL